MCPNRSLIQGIQEGQGMTKSQICADITRRCPPTSVYTLVAARSLTHSLPPSRRSEERCFHTVDRLRLHALVRVPSFLLSKQRGRQSVARSLGAVWSHKSHSGLPPSFLGAARRGGGSKERQMRRWGLERGMEKENGFGLQAHHRI